MQVNNYGDKEVENYLICIQADTTERQTYAQTRTSGTATKTPMFHMYQETRIWQWGVF